MKIIQLLFEILSHYQEFKYKLKINYEKFKVDLKIGYAERMKEINSGK